MPYFPELKKIWKWTVCSKCPYGHKDWDRCEYRSDNYFPYLNTRCGDTYNKLKNEYELYDFIRDYAEEIGEIDTPITKERILQATRWGSDNVCVFIKSAFADLSESKQKYFLIYINKLFS